MCLDYVGVRFRGGRMGREVVGKAPPRKRWSLKSLHRLIMLSAVYQQTSENNPQAAKVDPGNQLLWRMNRARLDFEALRDTLLAVAGKIDLTVGGRPVALSTEPFTNRSTD